MDRTLRGSARVGSHAYLTSNTVFLGEATFAFLAKKDVSKKVSRKDYSIVLFETWLEMNHSSPSTYSAGYLSGFFPQHMGRGLIAQVSPYDTFLREENKVCSYKLLLVAYPEMQHSLEPMPEELRVCYQYTSPSADCQQRFPYPLV